MSRNHAYLLLQSVEKPDDFDFQNPLLEFFNTALKGKDHFILDNLSDGVSVAYAKKLIDQSESLIIICDEIKSETLGSLLPILNQCVKRPDTELLCSRNSKPLTPFIKMMKGRVFDSVEEISSHLRC
ncbi:MAG: hypothetical protein JXR03_21400 [Cyclobacteriaceae bacterium]